jgi:hypothetical protein
MIIWKVCSAHFFPPLIHFYWPNRWLTKNLFARYSKKKKTVRLFPRPRSRVRLLPAADPRKLVAGPFLTLLVASPSRSRMGLAVSRLHGCRTAPRWWQLELAASSLARGCLLLPSRPARRPSTGATPSIGVAPSPSPPRSAPPPRHPLLDRHRRLLPMAAWSARDGRGATSSWGLQEALRDGSFSMAMREGRG